MRRSLRGGSAPRVTPDNSPLGRGPLIDDARCGPSRSALLDWRDVDAAIIERCYAHERVYWRDHLAWDSSWTWAVVERARRSQALPGFVGVDGDGTVRGWTFHLIERSTLRIGGLVADERSITRQLVDRTIAAARTAGAAAVACFITSRAAGLADLLRSRGGTAEPFHYLASPLDTSSGRWSVASSDDVAPWDGDIAAASDLLSGAYAPGAAIHFADEGTREDWVRYVRQLVEQHGCGTIDRAATLMVRDARGLAALALVTSLAPTTAHLAQLAVRADRRGEGLARRVLAAAAAAARAQGRTTMTLLVGDGNRAARHLYEQLGFASRAEFTAARLAVESTV